jgi:hypothetical protein
MAALTPPQFEFINDTTTPEIAFSGGLGAGKTLAGAAKGLDLATLNQGYPGIVWAPTQRDAKEGVILAMLQMLRGEHPSGLHVPYPHKYDKQSGYITLFPDNNGGRETVILVRSGEQDVVGTNAAWAVADELDTLPKQKARNAWLQLIQRTRAGRVRQVCAITTPEGYRHLYQHFLVDVLKMPSLAKQRRLITASMRSNPTLDDQYIKNVISSHTPEEAEARVEGKFVNLAGGTVYRHFNRTLHNTHLTAADFPEADIWCGIDFNMGKMAAIIAIHLPDRLIAIDEFVGTKNDPIHDTPHLIELIQARYGNRVLHACPDASGENRNTNGWLTSIGQLEQAGFTCHHDKANPSIVEVRVPACNRLLHNKKLERSPHVEINVERCPLLVEALEQQPWDENGKPLIDKIIDHRLDAFGYLCVQTFGEQVLTLPQQVAWQQ